MAISYTGCLTLGGCLAIATALSLPAHADDDIDFDDTFNALDHRTEKGFEGSAEFGYTRLTGNSDSETLLSKGTGTWYDDAWSYSLHGEATSASEDGEQSAEEYIAAGRTRYNLDDRNYLFGVVRWDKDRFSGYDSQTTLAGGYGRQLLEGPVHTLSLEGGPGLRHDVYDDGDVKNLALAYGAVNYKWQVSDTAAFTEGVVGEATDENVIGRSETALQVAINQTLSLKVAYQVEHNTNPPSDAESKTDTRTAVSLVYGL
ncbi:DUF481 domain-containing protein [Larsenimonas rhizosphaerae]|uniref:DUF481 domain-containing protein n=1 Tax=Larsenimonas rhizosphaerae TaxID=2944682 RepID=A0AA42CXW6_9GAMM|nr:DUF481 domain-containing protein [Larsenimonas rhizosphaerae]MCM2129704.1 DUF481 domain-containing protein [Larsenimonas rhizosphaerae]MCX2524363.1 DUF481 domain-containing protein [Larsenimonas rhizosphaerae]